jgi:hypothetical protein
MITKVLGAITAAGFDVWFIWMVCMTMLAIAGVIPMAVTRNENILIVIGFSAIVLMAALTGISTIFTEGKDKC